MKMSDQIRKSFKEGDDIRDAGLTTPEDIQRFDDISYGPEAGWQVLDVYRPKAAEGPLPVIVSVHGGGWVYGDKERYQYYCMQLAQNGFAVVNFTYRLAPEFKFPASMEDTGAVFSWVLQEENAKTYGFDTNNIFAVGDSAGSHMLSLYSTICTNPDCRKLYPTVAVPEGFVPNAVALNCGKFTLEQTDVSDVQTAGLMGELFAGGGTDEELHQASPCYYVTGDFPPAFVMTATGDFLQDQGPFTAQFLIQHNVPFELHFYGDKDHELGHVFHCNMRLEEGRKCNQDECDFFKKHMR